MSGLQNVLLIASGKWKDSDSNTVLVGQHGMIIIMMTSTINMRQPCILLVLLPEPSDKVFWREQRHPTLAGGMFLRWLYYQSQTYDCLGDQSWHMQHNRPANASVTRRDRR